MIKIYDRDGAPNVGTKFSGLGYGALRDAITCKVVAVTNGKDELTLTYPESGLNAEYLLTGNVILAKPEQLRDPQPYRIKKVKKTLAGTITVTAVHIRYDLNTISVSPFVGTSLTDAAEQITDKQVPASDFVISSTMTSSKSFGKNTPVSAGSLLVGEGSLAEAYGGFWEFDGFTAKLKASIGQNRGTAIRYGKNLIDAEMEENIENVITGVYPFWIKDSLVTLPEKTVSASGTFPFEKIQPLDLTSLFNDPPTAAQLRTAAQEYITAENIGIPKVSLTVKFQPLADTEEYKDIAELETVSRGDTVKIVIDQIGVTATAQVIETDYDVIAERYNSVKLGDPKLTAAQTIAQASRSASSAKEKTDGLETGSTLIDGNCIRTGKIMSHDGSVYFDLVNGILVSNRWQKGEYRIDIVDDTSSAGGKAIVFSNYVNGAFGAEGWYEFMRFRSDPNGLSAGIRFRFPGRDWSYSTPQAYLDIKADQYESSPARFRIMATLLGTTRTYFDSDNL